MKRNKIITVAGLLLYFVFILFSSVTGFEAGKRIGGNFITFSADMFKLIPFVFVLIGLFEVWVRKETVEKHFGEECGFKGYLFSILLAGGTLGGLYVAFPVVFSLYNKGAKLSVIFTYIGAAAICRIPMMTFEATFMGVKFTAIRLLVSLPLVIVSSILLGNYLTKRNYKIMDGC